MTTATEAPPTMTQTWVGWYRTGARWRRACQGATLDECARRLDAATRSMNIRNTDVIMTGGGYPRCRPTPNPRRPAHERSPLS